MKKTIRYKSGKTNVEKVINYIPVRYIFAVLITVVEVLAIIGIVVALCYFVPYFYLAAWATQIFCVIKIASSEDNPDYKIPWLLFVMSVPIAGFMIYFIFYSRKLQKKYIRRLTDLKKISYPIADEALFAKLKEEEPTACGQAQALVSLAETHLFSNTRQEYFPLGEDMHARMLEDLKRAEKFIFMEYFIVEEGEFWNSILEILKEKAKAGVEIKLVYDDIGCMSTLPGNYAKILKKDGIDATPFSRLKGNADSEFNNRSHRKIAVVDGCIGYTGGVNIADEYINRVERFGHWKDIAVRLEGEAVRELTKLFLIDYGINTKETVENTADYFPTCGVEADGYLIPFGDGPKPIYERRVGQTVIRNMLAGAKEYAYITTPYLIIDNELCIAIETAALRGVKVKIVTPHIPDKKMVFAMTRSFYPRLMSAGVEIYEYEPGFIHAKSYLVDGKIAMIGTINLDYRSLVHHFENGVWFYGGDAVKGLEADMTDTLEKSIRITPNDLKTNLLQKVLRALVRIFAPLL